MEHDRLQCDISPFTRCHYRVYCAYLVLGDVGVNVEYYLCQILKENWKVLTNYWNLREIFIDIDIDIDPISYDIRSMDNIKLKNGDKWRDI